MSVSDGMRPDCVFDVEHDNDYNTNFIATTKSTAAGGPESQDAAQSDMEYEYSFDPFAQYVDPKDEKLLYGPLGQAFCGMKFET